MLFQVLDENHLVALFVVDNLVHRVTRDEHAEAAGTNVLRLPNFHVSEWIVLWIGNGGVLEFCPGEAFAGVNDVVDDSASCAYSRNAHPFVRIELSAMLNGVEKHFSKCCRQLDPVLFRQGGWNFCYELRKPVGCLHAATQAASDEVGFSRKQVDAVGRIRRGESVRDRI